MDIKKRLLKITILSAIILFIISYTYYYLYSTKQTVITAGDYYGSLPDTSSEENPLEYISEDFTVDVEGFSSNLPLVVLHCPQELPKYKYFDDGLEHVDDSVNPWAIGSMDIIDIKSDNNRATLHSKPDISTNIKIKKRGHTSIEFDKSQFYIKTVDDKEEQIPVDIFGMGEESEWVLNGSMADKSMIRNYLPYRIAAQIMEYAPRCKFCEVIYENDGVYIYQGVYLMTESIKVSPKRVNVDESKRKNVYTSYMVRRDRDTSFDTILDTYGTKEGLTEEYIGIKYPSIGKQTKENIEYITSDFSTIEKVLYSEESAVFSTYDSYIDADTFVDYFLINEYFGNYDAGEHSTYMYKNSGDRLKIGPVWDFDQAMNNASLQEADPLSIAMQDRAFFAQLSTDTVFVDKLKNRYSQLRASYLNDEYIFAIIDETTNYLQEARAREWYRWAADYNDGSGEKKGNYYLQDYKKGGVIISRFNDDYNQELYNIKTYLSLHGSAIQRELSGLKTLCTVTTGYKGQMTLFLIIVMILFLIPSIIINRK